MDLTKEPIAIIGSAYRFPGGSNSSTKLWELLSQPRDIVREFDSKRLNLRRFYHPDGETHGSTDVNGRSYLLEEDSRMFDAGFFGINPVEAAGMDPQQRLLLETTYEACERAGVPLEKLRGSLTSVHVGVMSNDYASIQSRDTETLPKYNATGTANSILSNRVSYVFDLKGPSVTIDTACSGSLVALHYAVQSLRGGDSNMAIVGGTNLLLDPTPYIAESKLHMLSPDSYCRMWDKAANGYARGEGIAALVLKPLGAALRDGDLVEGVVRATGVNSDGASSGITMPLATAQTALIRQVYRRAGLDPVRDPPQYVECHGTGTQAGDPVEARAVYDGFYRDEEKGIANRNGVRDGSEKTIYVGSVKTVIGHLEGCAGLAGVIKVLLALKHRKIPPNMHFSELNAKIAPYYGPGALVIPTELLQWPQPAAGSPMRASINSFGFGGTNAHVIMESSPSAGREETSRPSGGAVGPLLLSANSGPALLQSVQQHLDYLQKNVDVHLGDLSCVLQTRRSSHRVRASFTGTSRQEIVDAMSGFIASHSSSHNADRDATGTVARLINAREGVGILGVFTGQGAQWATMGSELLHASPLFRQSIEGCEAVLKHKLLSGHAPKWSLIEELTKDAASSRLSEAELAQPLCTALQIGLVDLLAAAGVRLGAVVGHSSGEIAAAYAAGIISVQAAMQIAYYRGYYARLCSGGGMMAVGLSNDAAVRFCRQHGGRLVVAASNAPQSCTLSGDMDALDAAKKQLDGDGTFARKLLVDTAYHSHHMQACAGAYLDALHACDIHVAAPKSGCVWNSSVRGDTRLLRDLSSLRGPYWVANMVQTVKFSQAVESSIWHGGPWDMVVELGPHAALKGPTTQTLKAAYGTAPPYVGLLARNASDVQSFQAAIGALWTHLGPGQVDFAGYSHSFAAPHVMQTQMQMLQGLPTYPWDHSAVHWRESRTSRRYRTGRHVGHPLLGRRVPDDNDRELRWRNVLKLAELPWLRGHNVLGAVLLPAAAYVSVAAEAALQLGAAAGPARHVRQLSVEHVNILRPVLVPDNKDGVETLFTVHVQGQDGIAPAGATAKSNHVLRAQFSYYACQDEATGAMMHTCSGSLVVHFGGDQPSATAPRSSHVCVLPQRQSLPEDAVHIGSKPIYDMFRAMSLDYAGAFSAIAEAHRRLDYAAATAVWPADSPISSTASHYVLHPAILDVAFQTLFVAHMHPASEQAKSALLPSHVDRVIVDPQLTVVNYPEILCKFDAWVTSTTGTSVDGDINIYDSASGRAFVQVEGLSTRAADRGVSLEKHVFCKTVYGHDISVGGLIAPSCPPQIDSLLEDSLSTPAVTDHAISQVMKQISFKFPRCNMLEIGNGTGTTRTAQSILDAIGDMYDSYTYTDTSSPMLSNAVAALASYERVKHMALDLHKDLHIQGFSDYSYDVIIAPHVLSALSAGTRLDSILTKVRLLLRPGGYLVLSDMTRNEIAVSSSGSTEVPTLLPAEWHEHLRFSGFSGTDTVFQNNARESPLVHTCITARAVNDDFLRLLQPLVHPALSIRPLIIVGGRRMHSRKIVDQMEQLLQSIWRQSGLVRVISSIDDFNLDDLEDVAVDVVCLQDIDETIFAQLPMSDVRLEKLQQLLMSAKNLIWVTGAGTSRVTRASIIFGVARVIPVEMPQLTMQVLGIDLKATGDPATDARYCAEALLRLQYMDELKVKAHGAQTGSNAMLWAIEPESERLANGYVRIERVVLDKNFNERYNARTRTIIKTVDATDVAVRAIVPKDSSRIELQVVEAGTLQITRSPDQAIPIQVKYALRIPSGSQDVPELYIVCGEQPPKTRDERGQAVMAVSAINASQLSVEANRLVSVDLQHCTPGSLVEVAHRMLTFAVASQVERYAAEQTKKHVEVLLFEPEKQIAQQIQAELAHIGHRVHCASFQTDVLISDGWTRLHENMSKRMVRHSLPACEIDFLIDCSTDIENETDGVARLRNLLPPAHKNYKFDAQLLQTAMKIHGGSLAALVQAASIKFKRVPETGEMRSNCDTVAVGELHGADAKHLARQWYITDWSQREALKITVQPLNTNTTGLLRPDRTYLMVGSSTGLGISLSRWMLNQGAKHIVITSRNPKGNAGLEEEARRVGAVIRFLAMDITHRDQVVAVVDDIRKTMPPIAGVCNLAMVLHDRMFLDMSAAQFNGTLEAKVVGTEILDSIFNNSPASPPLDFFILTSSLTSIVGNIGQANYHAANLFMKAVMERRRAQELAASVIHIGWIADTGYVARSDKKHQLADHFRSIRFVPLSEVDVQHAFAQAIRTSKPRVYSDSDLHCDSGSYEITMGLELPTQPMGKHQTNKAQWVSCPRLLSLAPYDSLTLSSSQPQLAGQVLTERSLRRQVEEAETEQIAMAAIALAFASQLENMLLLPVGSVTTDLERPIIEIGIDSLVATEIRAWFLKTLDVEVDVIRILGGDSVKQISALATKGIWSDRNKERKETEAYEELVAPVAAASAPVSSVTPTAAVSPTPLLLSSPDNLSLETCSIESTSPPSRSIALDDVAATSVDGTSSVTLGSSDFDNTSRDDAKDDRQETKPLPAIIHEAPMSAAQSQIWFVSNHHEDPTAENNVLHYHIQGGLSIARLRRAFHTVVDHHECLRTCFYSHPEDGRPMQGVMTQSAFALTMIQPDLDFSNISEYEARLHNSISDMKSRKWELEQGCTMAAIVLGRTETEWDLVIGYHHILMDGWSASLFFRDLDRAYRLQPLEKPVEGSCIDYAVHQLSEESRGALDADIAFWRAEFNHLPENLPLLPMARSIQRPNTTREDIGSHYLDQWLSNAQLAAQKDLCKRLGISSFHLHLTLLQVLLARLANIEDVCVGVVDANRRDKRFRGTVGCFVNMLPVRCSVSGTATFAQVAQQTSRKAMQVLPHSSIPFDRMLDHLQVPRTPGVNPLFQAAINYRSTVGGIDILNLPLGEDCRMHFSAREAKDAENPYDVSLAFLETKSGCLIQIYCLASLYDLGACHTMLETYLHLLEAVAHQPYTAVADVVLHNPAGVKHAIQVGTGPDLDFGWPALLSQRVQDMCLSYPTTTAITDMGGEGYSYAQLEHRIALARQMMEAEGMRPGTRVAVLCEPSMDCVVAMLAIIYAGGVYVPLDTSLPAFRHADMMRLSESALLLCHAQTDLRVQELLEI